MNTKQRSGLIILVLMVSILVVVTIISIVPFTFVVNGGGNGDENGDENGTPPPLEIPDSPILRLMVNSPSTDGEIVLEWDLVSNADDYAVYRSKNSGSLDFLKEIDVNYYDDLVTESGDYSYIVKAGNEAGISDFSNTESITVQLEGIPEAPFMNELDYEIVGRVIRIYLDWDEVDCDSYNVYRSVNYSDYEPIENNKILTSYSEDLTEVGVYEYYVTAVNTYGESEISQSVIAVVTEDGEPPVEPPVDYVVPIVVILVLSALALTTVILVKENATLKFF